MLKERQELCLLPGRLIAAHLNDMLKVCFEQLQRDEPFSRLEEVRREMHRTNFCANDASFYVLSSRVNAYSSWREITSDPNMYN